MLREIFTKNFNICDACWLVVLNDLNQWFPCIPWMANTKHKTTENSICGRCERPILPDSK